MYAIDDTSCAIEQEGVAYARLANVRQIAKHKFKHTMAILFVTTAMRALKHINSIL